MGKWISQESCNAQPANTSATCRTTSAHATPTILPLMPWSSSSASGLGNMCPLPVAHTTTRGVEQALVVAAAHLAASVRVERAPKRLIQMISAEVFRRISGGNDVRAEQETVRIALEQGGDALHRSGRLYQVFRDLIPRDVEMHMPERGILKHLLDKHG